MSRYIDADALKRWIQTECNPYSKPTMPYGVGIRILNYIDNMPAADVEPVSRWISVDERLPEYEGSYLVCTANSGAFISHYYPQHKRFNGANGHITHWMNRPEPPKMDGGSER